MSFQVQLYIGAKYSLYNSKSYTLAGICVVQNHILSQQFNLLETYLTYLDVMGPQIL